MKTTKKIFAAVLAVMMIALMIPFSASAATGYSAKYKLDVNTATDPDNQVITHSASSRLQLLTLKQANTQQTSVTALLRLQ